MATWDFYTRVRNEIAVDSGDGLTFDLVGKDIQLTPVPQVYINYAEQTTGYTVNNGDQSTEGSVTFDVSQTGNTITVTYRWKYEMTADEFPTVYVMDKVINQVMEVDISGFDIIGTSYEPFSGFRGVINFEYISQAFWNYWKIIADNSYTFDLAYTGFDAPFDSLENLLLTMYPRFEAIPDVPSAYMCVVECVQLNSV